MINSELPPSQFHKEQLSLSSDQEKKEKEPNINVKFFFSAHMSEKDMEKISQELEKADVYIPEMLHWDIDNLNVYHLASKGILKKQDIQNSKLPEKIKFELNLLVDLNKKRGDAGKKEIKILFADLPDNPFTKKIFDDMTETLNIASNYFLKGDLDQAILYMKVYIIRQGEFQKARELFIKENIGNKIKTITEIFPELKDNDDINILVSIGAIHTSLFYKLKKELPQTKQVRSDSIIIYPTASELIRRKTFGKEKEIQDIAYARILLETYISQILLDPLTKDTLKISKVSRKLAEKLNMDEIKEFINKFPKKETFTQKNFINLLSEVFRNKNIKIPENEKEIDEFLESKY